MVGPRGAPEGDAQRGSDSGPSDAGESSHGSAELDAAMDAFLEQHVARSSEEALPELDASAVLPPLQPGTQLGDFVLGPTLGEGGMGVVFQATQASLQGRLVAVKVMRSPLAGSAARARFRREIAAVGRLDHPAIVPVVGAGVEQGIPYFAMKAVPGVSLRRILERLRRRKTPPRDSDLVRGFVNRECGATITGSASMSWEPGYVRWIACVGMELADALQHAHERGVVHRDVKPANILIEEDGGPVLVDFGLASEDSSEHLTHSGAFLGTQSYAAPEQLSGAQVDCRTDVYALGVTLYELLSLRLPHDGANRDELRRSIELKTPPPLGRAVPRDLETICKVALAERPEHRYPTAGAMAADLRAFLANEPIQAQPPGPLARALLSVRRHPRTALALCVVMLFVLGQLLIDTRRAASRVRQGEQARAELALLEAALDEKRSARRALLDPSGMRVAQATDVPRAQDLAGDVARLEAEHALAERRTLAHFRGAWEFVSGYEPARERLAELHAGRVRRGLAALDDLRHPEELAEHRAALATHDHDGLFGGLQDDTGAAWLGTEPPGAQVSVRRPADDCAWWRRARVRSRSRACRAAATWPASSWTAMRSWTLPSSCAPARRPGPQGSSRQARDRRPLLRGRDCRCACRPPAACPTAGCSSRAGGAWWATPGRAGARSATCSCSSAS